MPELDLATVTAAEGRDLLAARFGGPGPEFLPIRRVFPVLIS
jgi:hypothetical protein